MNKVIGSIIAIVIAILVIVLFKNMRSDDKSQSAKDTFYSGAFAFKTQPVEKLGVAAKIMKTEVPHSELLKNSPVLRDLTLSKLQLLTKSIEKKVEGMTKSAQKPLVTLYMEPPTENFNFESSRYSYELNFSDERPKDFIVKINDQNFLADELPLNQVRYAELDTQIFDEKLRLLADLYTKNLLLKVSKENNTTIQGFINRTILSTPIQVSNDEVEDFAKNRGLNLNEDSSLMERLRNTLKQNKTQETIENYIVKHYPHETGSIYFRPPSLKIPVVDSKALIEPENSAPSPTLLVFSRLKCNSCRQLSESLNEVRKLYKDKVRIGFVHYFSSDNWQDHLAAEASMCLNLQSHEAFWDFFNKISRSDENITESLILETAKSTGVDFENFKKCFVGQSYKKEVEKQMTYAKDLGVTISPTVIFDTKVLTGNIAKRQLETAIKAGL